jgi:type II secretory ATPase GspE/PulE/Tfp pilus assembly ATPase PilB-like protein
MSDDPIRRFTLLVLHQAQEDHATRLVIGPTCRGEMAIRYRVGDQLCEMSPPPAHVISAAIAEIGRLAGSPEGRFPIKGSIDVAYSGHRLKWRVAMASKDAECILTPVQ